MNIDTNMLKLLKGLNALYVDDEQEVLNFAKMALGNIFKNLYTSLNGLDALQTYEKELSKGEIQIVISDINMPKMNGIEFVKKVKQLNDEIEILLISGNAESEYLIEAINNGISSFILKPIQVDVLLNKTLQLAKHYTNEQVIKNQTKELENYIGAIDKVAIISHTDLKGTITYVNDVFCKVSGYSKEELLGQPHNIVRHPEMPKSAFKDMWETIQANNTWSGKVKNKAKDGSTYYTQVYIFPHYNHASNEKKGYIGVRYITTKEELERLSFRKKVIENLSTWKQKEKELCEQIELYKDKATDTSKDAIIEALNEKVSKELKRNSMLLFKIDSLENDVAQAKNSKVKIIENLKENLTATHKKYLESKKESTYANEQLNDLKRKNEDKTNEIKRLNGIVNEQKKLIENLKDVIAHLDEKIIILKEGTK